MALQDEADRLAEVARPLRLGIDLEVELHALLPRAAVDVVEDVDGRRHRVVHASAARHAIRAIAIEGAWGP